MIRLLVIVAVTLRPAAHPVQIRRIAVDQLPPFKGKPGQKPVCAPVHPLDRVVAAEALDRPCVQIDADVPERGWLALHDRAATQMRFDVDVVRRHHRDQRLAQPRRGLRTLCCGPDYVADGSQRPTTHENFSYVRNIIFYNQSAPKTAIRRLFAFRGRPDPDSVPSQSVITFAFIAFISRSISA